MNAGGEEAAGAVDDPVGAAGRAHAAHDAAVATASAPLVAMGNDLLKAVAFINGGAAVATLFCIGTFVRDLRTLASLLVLPLTMFGFGLAVAAFATGWSYMAQADGARALALRRKIDAAPFVVETEASGVAARRGDLFRRLAFAAVLLSVASAVAGFSVAGILLWWGIR